MSQRLEQELENQSQCQKNPGVFVRTFGCQMNEYDSEKMISLLSSTHHRVQTVEDASVIIVNTCSVREKAENKLYSLLGELRKLKKAKPELVIGVSGCVAQQEGRKIVARNSAVDFVVGTQNLSLVPSLVNAASSGAGPQVAVDYREEWEDLPEELSAYSIKSADEFRTAASSSVRALVAIQRGCNKNCSFCVVPTTRGPEVSRSPEEIVREIKLKVRLGVKEVLLLGQTVNSYGRDLDPRYSFEKLIRQIAEIEGLERIRFTSPHPAEVRPKFLDLYKEVPQLVPHIHLPLQSGSDRVLKSMNRNYRVARYLEIVESLKERCPEIALSSDIIVGYPTETEEDFQATMDVLRKVRYHIVYSFKYSVRPNTVAKELFEEKDLINKEVASRRLLDLQQLQDQISYEINKVKVGSIVEVLVEGRGEKITSVVRGRNPQNTLVEVSGGDPQPGDMVNALVEYASPHGLKAKLLS